MMKRTIALCALVAAVVGGPLVRAADAPQRRMFAVSLAITESKDGQQKTLAEPTLIVRDGENASFQSGGEVPTDAEKTEFIEFGLRARITVREKAADRLRVSLYVGGDEVNARDESGFTVRQSGARCEKTIKSGDTFVVDMGEGRQARVAVLAVGGK